MIQEHRPARLVRGDEGGFELRAGTADPIRAVPVAGGWRVDGPGIPPGWSLHRADGEAGGFLLRTAEGLHDDEAARTAALDRSVGEREGRTLLTGDGRLFRVALRGPRDVRFELLGWETPGPYLVAWLEADGWRIEPMPASGGIDDLREIAILFAAEVLDAEELLVGGDCA